MRNDGKVRFVRVRGRVVPIREKVGSFGAAAMVGGAAAVGAGQLLHASGMDKLVSMKIFRPVKNPFRGFSALEKSKALKKVASAQKLMSAGSTLHKVGVGVGTLGLAAFTSLALSRPFLKKEYRNGRR